MRSKTPVKTDNRPLEPARSSETEVESFLARLNAVAPVTTEGRGRLIFAMDATMSRQPTWDLALGLQADMFRAVSRSGGWTSSWCISEALAKPAPANG